MASLLCGCGFDAPNLIVSENSVIIWIMFFLLLCDRKKRIVYDGFPTSKRFWTLKKKFYYKNLEKIQKNPLNYRNKILKIQKIFFSDLNLISYTQNVDLSTPRLYILYLLCHIVGIWKTFRLSESSNGWEGGFF